MCTMHTASWGDQENRWDICLPGCRMPNSFLYLTLKMARRDEPVSALVQAPGHGLLLVPSVDVHGPTDVDDRSGVLARLVLDRVLVQRGDTLHVTGACAPRMDTGGT